MSKLGLMMHFSDRVISRLKLDSFVQQIFAEHLLYAGSISNTGDMVVASEG